MEEIIKKLYDEFSFYKSDISYFENLVNDYGNNEEAFIYIRSKIISSIQNDFENLNNDWFVTFINKSLDKDDGLLKISKKSSHYNLFFTILILQDLINKCPLFESALADFFKGKEKLSSEIIEAKAPDTKLAEIYTSYGLINDLIVIETDFNVDSDQDLKSIYYSDNSVKMYLQEVRTLKEYHEEKRDFYLQAYTNYKEIYEKAENEEEKENLEQQILKYRNLIIEANLSLVVAVAKKYQNKGLDLLELCQEGSKGLFKALEKYDIKKGYAFSTYAFTWIRQAITRALHNLSKPIRVPVHMAEKYNRIYMFSEALEKKLGRVPKYEEIAQVAGVNLETVEEAFTNLDRIRSLDSTSWSNDDDNEFYAIIKDEKATFEDTIINKETIEELLPYVDDATDEFIIRMRYGIDNGKDPRFKYEHTLEEVAKELNVTRERVRQRETKAIRKMYKKVNNGKSPTKRKKEKLFASYFDSSKLKIAYEKVKLLSDSDQEILYERYGDNLDTLNNLGSKKNARAREVVRKVEKMVANPNYKPNGYKQNKNGPVITYRINPITKELEVIGKSDFPYEGKTLQEIFLENKTNYINSIDYEIKMLLHLAFGDDLEGKANTSKLSKEDIKKLRRSLSYYERKIVGYSTFRQYRHQGKTLQELLNCNKDQIDAITSKYKDTYTYEILIKLFGTNFDKKSNFNGIIAKERKMFEDFYQENVIATTKWRYDGKSIQEILGCSQEELDYVLNFGIRKENSKKNIALEKFVKGDLLTIAERHTFEINIQKMKKKLDNYRINKLTFKKEVVSKKNPTKRKVTDKKQRKKVDDSWLYDGSQLDAILSCTKEELDFILSQFKSNSRVKKILLKFISGKELSKEEKQLFKDLIIELKNNMPKYRNEINNISKQKMGPYNNKTLEEILNKSKDEIDLVINSLDKESSTYRTIVKFNNHEELSHKEKRILENFINEFPSILEKTKEQNKINNLFATRDILSFLKCSQEELDFALSKLNKDKLPYNTIQKFLSKETLDGEEQKLVLSLINRFLNYIEKYRKEKATYKWPYEGLDILEILNCNKEELDYVISKISINSVFGRCLLNLKNKEELTLSEKQLFVYYLNIMHEGINEYIKEYREAKWIYDGKSINEILDCSSEELTYILSKLRKNGKIRKVIDKIIANKKLTNKEKKYFEDNLNELLLLKENYQESDWQYFDKTLMQILKCHKKEIESAMSSLRKNGKDRKVLEKFMNHEKLSKKEKELLEIAIDNLQKIISENRKNTNIRETYQYYGKSFSEMLGCSEELAAYILTTLDDASVVKQTIIKASNKEKIEKVHLPNFYQTIRRIKSNLDGYQKEFDKKQLLNNNPNLNIQEKIVIYFGCDLECANYVLSHFDLKKERVKLLEDIIDGKEIKKKDSNRKYILIRDVKLRIEEYKKNNSDFVEILTPQEYDGPKTPLVHPFFKELLKTFPEEYRHITELKLGLAGDNIMYDDKTIAELYGMSTMEVKFKLDKGMTLFRRLIDEYKNVFNADFPTLNADEESLIRKNK